MVVPETYSGFQQALGGVIFKIARFFKSAPAASFWDSLRTGPRLGLERASRMWSRTSGASRE